MKQEIEFNEKKKKETEKIFKNSLLPKKEEDWDRSNPFIHILLGILFLFILFGTIYIFWSYFVT